MKQIKKIISLLLILCLSFSVIACGNTKTEIKEPENQTVEQEITPLLYKVTDENGNVCWLFGSIHVGEEDFFPLPDYVNNAYNEADSLAVECDIIAFEKDLAAQTAVMQTLIFKDGSTISDHISEDIYNRAVEILAENDMYMQMMDYYYPIMWSSLIDNFMIDKMDVNVDLGIDRHLMELAMEEEKEILEVESVQLQYDMLANYSMKLQALLLDSSIVGYDNLEESEASMKELVKYWKTGDEENLVSYLSSGTEEMTDEEKELYKEYNDALIVERNIGMADFAEESLKSGKKVFICVGAAHVVGDGGMVDLLEERGHTVESVR